MTRRSSITLLLLAVSLAAQSQPREDYAFSLGVQAYLYAYPLILMHATEQTALGRRIPVNHFAHLPALLTPASRVVVYPNVDTLYSSAWLDLSQGPQTLHVPDMQGRYYTMQFMDAWSDNLAYVGTRTNGGKASDYVIVPPRWKGAIPAGGERIQSPTNTIWLLGRILAAEGDDLQQARALQRQITLNGITDGPPPAAQAQPSDPPPKQVAAMNAQEFFGACARLMQADPAHAQDLALVRQFQQIGLRPGEDFNLERLDPDTRKGLSRAVTAARAVIESKIGATGETRNGWQFQEIGKWGTDYLRRATFAWLALAGNDPEEAIYVGAFTDAQHRPLDGAHRYKLHFASHQTPPVNAFWSVTMYDAERYLVENPLHRYAIRDRTPGLRYNADGSLDIYLQREAPAGKESNWLPAPAGEFSVQIRLYLPRQEVIGGAWKPPAIERINSASRAAVPRFQGKVGQFKEDNGFSDFMLKNAGHTVDLDIAMPDAAFDGGTESTFSFFVIYDHCEDLPKGQKPAVPYCTGTEFNLPKAALQHQAKEWQVRGQFRLSEMTGPLQGLFAIKLTSAAKP